MVSLVCCFALSILFVLLDSSRSMARSNLALARHTFLWSLVQMEESFPGIVSSDISSPMGLGGRDAGGTTCRHVAHEWKPARMRSQKRSIHGWCLCELQSGDCRVAPLQQPPVLPKRLLLCRHQLDCRKGHHLTSLSI